MQGREEGFVWTQGGHSIMVGKAWQECVTGMPHILEDGKQKSWAIGRDGSKLQVLQAATHVFQLSPMFKKNHNIHKQHQSITQ